jgi:multiple antibiotic resistance protein
MEIFTAAMTLLLIMDPLGNIPVFMSVLHQLDPQRRHRVLIRELLISLVVLLVFLFLGQYLLQVLH